MIREDTVIILGAGASRHYNFPLGSDFVKGEIKRLEGLGYGSYDNLGGNPEFIEFVRKLQESKTVDTCLRDNPKLVEIGKHIVASFIIGCEVRYSDAGESLPQFFNQHHWIKLIVESLISGVKEPSDILKNKLTFVTFNYDNSLEYYLYNNLLNKDKFSEVFKGYLTQLEIFHVYGEVRPNLMHNLLNGCPDYEVYGYFQMFGKRNINEQYFMKTNRWQQIQAYMFKNPVNIRVIGESEDRLPDNVDKIRSVIRDADRLVFLGYGFDETNNDLIGLNDYMTVTGKIMADGNVKRKSVFYTNYGDSLAVDSAVNNILNAPDNYENRIRKSNKDVFQSLEDWGI